MPALQHLGGDTWRTSVFVGRDENGKQRRLTRVIHASTPTAAAVKAEKARVELRELAATERAHRQSFAGYIDQWLTESAARIAPTTMTTYRLQARKIAAEFGSRDIRAVTTPDIRAWYARLLASGVTPVTLASINAVFRAVLRQAMADGKVDRVATFGIKRPPVEQRRLDLPANQTIEALIASASPDLAIAARLAALGLRRGEVVGLRWSDITGRDLAIGEHRRVKTARSRRTVAIAPGLLRHLARHRARQADDAHRNYAAIDKRADRWILANTEADPTGQTPWAPADITGMWRQHAAAHGLGAMHFHDLRHWAASRLFAAHTPPHEVAEQLGHAKVSTTLDIYGQVLDKTARRRARGAVLGS